MAWAPFLEIKTAALKWWKPETLAHLSYSQLKHIVQGRKCCAFCSCPQKTKDKSSVPCHKCSILPNACSGFPAYEWGPQRRKHRKNSVKNEGLGLVKNWRGFFCWGKFFNRKLNDAISNLRKIPVSCAVFITQSFLYFEVLTFWAGHMIHHSFSLSWAMAELPGDGSDCGASWKAWSC